jgi:FkbM family methyltransferase
MLIPFDVLFKKYKLHPPGVLHLGANTGQEALAYARQGVKRVVWVEALPQAYTVLARNVAKYPGSVALLACLSDVDGEPVQFNVASNEGQSSSFLELGTHAQEHPSVKYVGRIPMTTVRADTLLERAGVALGPGWFLNVDLQGAELLALRGLGQLINHFDSVYVEVNERELYKGCPRIADIDAFLGLKGFLGRESKMTGNGWGDKFYTRCELGD